MIVLDAFVSGAHADLRHHPKHAGFPVLTIKSSPTTHQNVPSTPYRPTLLPTHSERVVQLYAALNFVSRCDIFVFKPPERPLLSTSSAIWSRRRLKRFLALCSRSHNFRSRKISSRLQMCVPTQNAMLFRKQSQNVAQRLSSLHAP
jgi:hypothetical protein